MPVEELMSLHAALTEVIGASQRALTDPSGAADAGSAVTVA